MGNIDVNTLREGDVVLVRGVVEKNNNGQYIRWHQNASSSVRWCDIVSVEPRPLVVGDKVKDRGAGSWVGNLISVDGDLGWVRISKNSHKTVWLDDVQRA